VSSVATPAELRRDRLRTLIASDFDGTLSPIVDDPAAARLIDGAAEVLVELDGRVGELAIISGRPLAHLQRHVPEGPTLVGLYGLESLRHGVRQDHPAADIWRPVVAAAVRDAARDGPAGVHVESKELSLTLHYRRHPELADQVAALADRLAAGTGLRVHPAKMSVELHPPIDEDKGTALERLASQLDGPVVFCGDDVGDLSAFDALDRLAAQGRPTLRVVAESPETDPVLRSRADMVVDGPAGVVALLRSIAED
jgi:trehalose 6-phosphate phosphatase